MIWRGRNDQSELERDLMDMGGLNEAEAKAMAQELDDEPMLDQLRLPASLLPAVKLAKVSASQMRLVPSAMSGAVAVGFDYPAVALAASWSGIEMTEDVFRDLREIEVEAVRILRDAA